MVQIESADLPGDLCCTCQIFKRVALWTHRRSEQLLLDAPVVAVNEHLETAQFGKGGLCEPSLCDRQGRHIQCFCGKTILLRLCFVELVPGRFEDF